MPTACLVITCAAIAAHAGIAVADLLKARFVLANSAEVGVPASWLPWLAALKAAGAGGLLLGLLGVPYIRVAAAVGLVLFYVGAMVFHVRSRVYRTIAFPGGYLGVSVAVLVCAVA
ncbi:DoxX family protein [Streptomyces palmae]|uniref:DoxX family protein n=1 Tax=Streptomyces palmae TaxID=1701085 RepID=A0A4Z0HEN6_9ACTN|nr:DoxX family protein [Streptomyces palmae]TGB17190.1 DoxX family protein [Streptomyces palmae]